MFTGIIADMGTVSHLHWNQETLTARIVADTLAVDSADLGASIACSGCCLTVTQRGRAEGKGWFEVDISPESLEKTMLSSWKVGTRLNLERALKVGDELGGHIVSGHVDAVASVVHKSEEGGCYQYGFLIPQGFEALVSVKGSVTLDGISLTVNKIEAHGDGEVFYVTIIPHTYSATTLHLREVGDKVNFEVDTFARYVARLQEKIRG